MSGRTPNHAIVRQAASNLPPFAPDSQHSMTSIRRLLDLPLLLTITTHLVAAIPTGKPQQLTSPAEVPEGLAKSDWASIRAAYEAERHAFRLIDGGWQAHNPRQQWITKFDGRGFMARPAAGGWQWGLELQSYGFAGQEHAISGVSTVMADGQRLTYQWDGVKEWFVNDQRGLEHGFTVSERPVGSWKQLTDSEEPLSFTLGVRGGLHPAITSDAQSVQFCDDHGANVLTYGGLMAWDADGKLLPSRFTVGEAGLQLLVDERGAHYPLTIDPIAQQARLPTGTNGPEDLFGFSVAVAGDTVVVGAHGEDSSTTGVNSTPNENATASGAAYVFTRSGTTWTQQAYLKASNTGAGDSFGFSVAVAGDTVVVGALGEDSSTTGVNSTPNENATGSGAAYVFTRSGTTWTQQAYLKASNTGASDAFGRSVAVSGNTVVVGAHGEDSSTTGVNSTPNENATASGAAYVFTRSGTTWTQQAYLKASNTGASDSFGRSVAVSGDTVVVGAHGEDSSTTGVNSTPNESGGGSGAAYVFTRSGTTWTQQAYLKASNTEASDYFGSSVAVSGDTVVVGAYGEDSSTTGVNSTPNENATDSGAAYVFTRSGTTWTQQAYLKASNTGASDYFGNSVAVSGDTVVVGAYGEDSSTTGVNSTPNENATNSGAAYVFTRSGTMWWQKAYLKASSSVPDDALGFSVAVSGDTVVVGDFQGVSAGHAYVFIGITPLVLDIDVEQSTGTKLVDGTSSIAFGTVVLGNNSVAQTFTIINTGTINTLTDLAVNKDGANPGDFTVNTTGMPTSVTPGNSATFTVTLSPGPGSSGARSSVIHITSNVSGAKNPFDITLAGQALSFATDTDGDGLNDASEFNMVPLGFDWQISQPALVNTYNANANGAGFYTLSQVRALNVITPLLAKDAATGKFKLTLGIQKSTDLLHFSPFPFTVPETSINPQGKLEFEFTSPDNAAFFRLQSQ
jgi:hypothetical protein